MPSIVRICLGVGVMVITFLVGMILMIDAISAGTFDVGLILFYSLGFPMIGVLLGIPLLCSGARSGISVVPASNMPIRSYLQAVQSPPAAEASFVYEPPTVCPDCGGKLTSTNVEWVGPLMLKCPYCGSSINAVKRQV